MQHLWHSKGSHVEEGYTLVPKVSRGRQKCPKGGTLVLGRDDMCPQGYMSFWGITTQKIGCFPYLENMEECEHMEVTREGWFERIGFARTQG